MKFLSFLAGGQARYGLLRDAQGIVDLSARPGGAPSLKALIARGDLAAFAAAHAAAPIDWRLSDVQLLPVIPDPAVIACVGHNYEAHRIETQRDPTEQPLIFFRYPESLRGHGQALLRPRESSQFDYEGEIAVVIGKPGRRIAEAAAWDHIAGVSCFNDGSVRDWQRHTSQFGPGKNFAATAGFGPWMVTLDELPADGIVQLTTRVNGVTVQSASTAQLIFPIPRLLAYVSTFMTLRPGDVIVTGTPGGVGAKRTPPLWLQPGDRVDVEVTHVGVLSNRIEQEAA